MMKEARFYLTILMHRLPLILLIAVLTTGAAVLYALSLPRSYTSSARLLVEAPQVTEGLSSSTVSTTPLALMNMVQQKIMARDNLVAMARRQDLIPAEDLSDQQIAQMVAAAVSMRSVGASTGDTNVITTITVNGDGAEKAAAVAQDIVDQVIGESTRQRTAVASGTMTFIQAEVDRLGAELDRRGQEIIEFQGANAASLPDGLVYRESRRAALRTDLASARLSLETLESQERSIMAIAQSGTDGGTLQTQLDEVRADLSQARLVFSESNPRVTRLVAREAQITEQMQAAGAAEATAMPEGTGNALADLQLADLSRRRIALQDQIPAIQQEIETLTAAIDATPANASALAVMGRELDAAQIRYNEARARLELAQSGERLELSDQAQRVTVLETPTVPAWPSKPARKLIAAAGLAGGIGLAFALVVLLELLSGRVRRSGDLVNALDITPIVTVPLLPKRARG